MKVLQSTYGIVILIRMFVATIITTRTIAASRRDRGKLNDVMMRSRRRLQCCAVFLLALSLYFSLSFALPIVDPLFSFNTKIDRCRTCLYASFSLISFLSFLFHIIIDLFALSTRLRRRRRRRRRRRGEDRIERRERLPFGINDVVVCSDEFVFIHVWERNI